MLCFIINKMHCKLLKRLVKTIILVVFLMITYWWLSAKSEAAKQSSSNALCIVLTTERTILTRGRAVWATWGKDCEKTIFACNCSRIMKLRGFMRDKRRNVPDDLKQFLNVSHLPIINLDIEESKLKMGDKVMLVLRKVYEMYKNKFSWFYMVDDDSYVFVNNLNRFTASRSAHERLLYGFRFKHAIKPNGFIGGGAGILFTNESMKHLVELIKNKKCDKVKDRFGDITIGRCSLLAGIRLGNSLDKHNRQRFLPHDPHTHFYGPLPKPIYTLGSHDGKLGKECCSLETISFHYVKPHQMHSIYSNKTFLKDLLSS